MSSQIALTIDVEWAHPEVLADVVRELDCRNLRATFFCTHGGIELEGHERALHPNYRRRGNTLIENDSQAPVQETDLAFYEYITQATMAFCPEAAGMRSHNLFWDSALAGVCRRAGLRYISNALLPLSPGLRPVSSIEGLVELPIYYMDYWDLAESATSFHLDALHLETDGLMVFDFHPNLIYINARGVAQYAESKACYHDPVRLAASRAPGRGVRTLFLELLDFLALRENPSPLLGDIAVSWQTQRAK